MTQTKVPGVALYTFIAAEQVLAVFIAVMTFQAVDDVSDAVLTSKYVHVNVQEHHLSIVIAHAICWLPVAALIALYLPTHGNSLSIFCGLGAHVLSFFSMHATITVQEHKFSDSYMMCCGGFLVLVVACMLLVTAGYYGKRAVLGKFPGSGELDEEQAEWVEKVDEIEHDFVAMALAFYLTMALRFIILGHFSHFDGVKPGCVPMHSMWHRGLLLIYLLSLVAVSMPLRSYLESLGDSSHSYVSRRMADFAKNFLSMSIAWAFILWGHWEIHERQLHWSPMMARLVFSAVCSGIMFVAVWVIACTSGDKVNRFAIFTVALIVGFTWEETINHSFDIVLEDLPLKFVWKVVVAFLISLVIVPVWAMYLKPLTLSMMSGFEASAKLDKVDKKANREEVDNEIGKL